jgi:S1-C subfamily serine protease
MEVDAMLTIVPIVEGLQEEDLPRSVHWGDSGNLGAGDAVMVTGFPMGSDLFFEHRSNRGVIQPTVYAATIAAVVPATTASETRLLRLTIPGVGGLSGGLVFNPKTGEMLGMMVSASLSGLVPAPVMYAIPTEALHPFVKAAEGLR